MSLKTLLNWWINQPWRLIYFWRCFLLCEIIIFFVLFDVVVNCSWKPNAGQERRVFQEARSDWVCKWWTVKVVLGFGCREALGGLGRSFSVGWWWYKSHQLLADSLPACSSLSFSLSPLSSRPQDVGVLLSLVWAFFPTLCILFLDVILSHRSNCHFMLGLPQIYISSPAFSLCSRFTPPTAHLTSPVESFSDVSDLTFPKWKTWPVPPAFFTCLSVYPATQARKRSVTPDSPLP